jgi:hypothetical protein
LYDFHLPVLNVPWKECKIQVSLYSGMYLDGKLARRNHGGGAKTSCSKMLAGNKWGSSGPALNAMYKTYDTCPILLL